jgi:aerobic-type carbon monoxide dehydrogenase small subunit (CoxS/CutS family)
MTDRLATRCTVNGEPVEADVPPRLLLSDFLRHDLKLTGTHVGCEMGVCGACTVVVDGQPVRSCLMFAAQADGADIRTVEGLDDNGILNPLQQAFTEHFALQCGYCTPGILMTLTAALENGEWPKTEAEARDLLSGNICRCTGYQHIVDAILAVRP